jgi:predicted O-methyltransferase YrrM
MSASGWKLLTLLDILAVAVVTGFAANQIGHTSALAGAACAFFAGMFLWSEGRRQVQLQRPDGIVFAEGCILAGACRMVIDRHAPFDFTNLILVLAGLLLLAYVLPSFLRGREEHRIVRQLSTQGEFVQGEWATPTQECPFPERWKMFDAQSAELEVLEFLKALVRTVKPDLIVETGTFVGHSAISMAEGLKENGFGRLITVEYDPVVFEKASRNIRESGLGDWIDFRRMSSLDIEIKDRIDILYSDSDLSIRESEVRKFLPQLKPGGLVLIHDASSSFQVVREAALRMEKEGLLSVLLLPTPRGLVIAQKRADRK